MATESQTEHISDSWWSVRTGLATLRQVMDRVEGQVASGDVEHLRPLPTGFRPLDEVLGGGLRSGELMIVGGRQGVGKTIFALQVSRNAVCADEDAVALYICYEHDRTHLLSRLLCLESAEQNCRVPLTLKKLNQIALQPADGRGLLTRLRETPGYGPVVEAIEAYSDRLVLVKASGDHSTLARVRDWIDQTMSLGQERLLVVVDYLQKVPVDAGGLQPETEVTTHLAQGLKNLAMETGVQVIAVAASDRPGLKSNRVQFADLRGSSALQYEADVGLMLNNKHEVLSRRQLIANLSQAEKTRGWLVLSVEKNRAGRNIVDMEHALQAPQFHLSPD
ncbi:MAG: DnaB-like helicase C-terminal domain-containing protein, partial [Anaerolineae bacterium]